jgi:hypothetical protein
MIVALYGLPGLSFAEITYMLTDLGIGFMAVTDRPIKVGDPDRKHVVPVVFNSARSFLMNHTKIKFRACAFVCDTYAKLKKEHGWEVVGVTEINKKKHVYTQFHKRELADLLQHADKLRGKTCYATETKVYDPASDLIKKFAQSALAQSQTMMYKVKNQDLRSKTFALVKGWFIGDVKTQETLNSRLSAIHSSDKYVTDLMVVLTSVHALSLRRVTIESRKNPTRIEALTKKANLSPFDVRYLLSKGKR